MQRRSTTTGLVGPAHLPPEFVKKVYDAIAPLHASAVFREKLAAISMTPYQATPPQFVAALARERKRFEQLVAAVGYQKENA